MSPWPVTVVRMNCWGNNVSATLAFRSGRSGKPGCEPQPQRPTVHHQEQYLNPPFRKDRRVFYCRRPIACRGLNGARDGYQPTGKVRVAGGVAKLVPRTERLAGPCGSVTVRVKDLDICYRMARSCPPPGQSQINPLQIQS